MPAQYEHIRDSEYRRLRKKGLKHKSALKKAKEIAARTWNKRHPEDPNPWSREAKDLFKK